MGSALSGRRLLFAVAEYFPYGGMQRSCRRIAEECIARGHSVSFFAARWDGDIPKGATAEISPVRAFTNHQKTIRFGRALADYVRRMRRSGSGFDLVVGFSKAPGLDLYYGGDPCYAARLHDEGRFWLRWISPRHRALIALERAVFGRAKKTESLLIAHGEREKFMRFYDTQAERFHLLPPGVEKGRLLPDRFDAAARAAARAEFGVAPDDVLLLNIAAHFRTKGVDRVLSAMAALDDAALRRARFFIVGGDDPEPLRAIADRLGLADRIRFFGARQDVGQFYRAADILVHPARLENTGTTLVEALIAALPVLTTTVCGYASHVRAAEGGVVLPEPFDPATFSDALEHLILDGESRERLAQNGAAYARRTDLSSLITAAADVIEKLASKRAGAVE